MASVLIDADLALVTNPIVTSQQLLRFRAADTDIGTSVRFATYLLTEAAGILLRLRQDVIATAIILLQRYQVSFVSDSGSSEEQSPRLLSAAAIYLAAKNSFTPVGPRSIVNAYAYLLCEKASPLRFIRVQDDHPTHPEPSNYFVSEGSYERERLKIFQYEAALLAGIGYDVHTALPYALALTYITALGGSSQKLCARVFEHLNSALLSPQLLYLTHQPNVIAVAAIYLAANEVGVKFVESVNWWEVFDVDRESLGFCVLALASLKGFAESEKGKQEILIVAAATTIIFTACGINFAFGVFQELYESMSHDPNSPFYRASPAGIDLIGTLSIALMTIGAPFATAWTKRYPPRLVTWAGGCVFCFALILASFCQRMWQFELTQGVLVGVGTCLLYMPAVTVTPPWFSGRRGLAMGIVLSGTGIGGVVWAPALRALINAIGFRNTLRFAGGVSFTLTMLAGYMIKWDAVTLRRIEAENASRMPGLFKVPLVNWRIARSRKFLAQALSTSLQSAAYYTPVFFFASYARTLGYSQATSANFIALSNAANAIGKIAIGHLADRLGRINALFITTALSAIATLALWLPSALSTTQADGRGFFIAFTVMYGIFASAYVSLFPASLVELFGVQHFASVNGILYMLRGMATLVGTPVAEASSSSPPPSPRPPPFSSLYFPSQAELDQYKLAVTGTVSQSLLASAPTPSFEEALAEDEDECRAFAETKAALPRDTKGESSGKGADDGEPPPPYSEGSSPIDSFTYVMASAGGPASIITQVQQTQGAPINTLGGDVGTDEHITLDLRGTQFTLSREELLTLPEFVLLSLFPNGLLPDGHMTSFHEGDVYPVDVCLPQPDVLSVLGNPSIYIGDVTCSWQYDPASLQYMLDFFRGVAQSIPSSSPSPTENEAAISIEPLQGSARDMLQDRAGIIVLREDLDFYVIPPRPDIDQAEMIEVKRAAAKSLLRQNGIFSGLKRSEETGTTEQHLIEMLTAGGFDHDDGWGHRAGEPNKAVICSLALARLRTDVKGDLPGSNSVGMAQKLLLFWRKPARRCWWEGIELDDVEGVDGSNDNPAATTTQQQGQSGSKDTMTTAAQSFVSSYAPRLRQYANSLLQPAPQMQSLAAGTRRLTGLRSVRREDMERKEAHADKYGREIHKPVDLQPIYRDWIIRRNIYPSTDREAHIQAQLPLTLIPIRVDVDVEAWQPDSPYPLPQQQQLQTNYNLALPMYKRPEAVPPFKLRDVFMWNLHESLITPDKFAETLVRELDLPLFQQKKIIEAISTQIRSQLEDYAGIALHPLVTNGLSLPNTPRAQMGASISRPASATPAASTPLALTPLATGAAQANSVMATASPIPPEAIRDAAAGDVEDPVLNPDDTYRCVITLSIYRAPKLYSDKFEWSLLHPPGAAEEFAKQTCADMGLGGEWVAAITHAIYEAVLRLKKEVCESGLMQTGGWIQGQLDNQAVREEEAAGWRYDVDDFGAEWEPKLEELSREEIEKREGDRERQLRRTRRDAARLTSTAGMYPSVREQEAQIRGSYFDLPGIGTGTGGDETPLMGRGERTKKKRRFRSLSPVAKAQTPDAYSSAGAAWGGEGSKLTDVETLCNNCGLLYERDKQLPVWSQGLHRSAVAHDAVLDYYGRRLATCSSDKTIKIFEIDGDQHRLTETLKGYVTGAHRHTASLRLTAPSLPLATTGQCGAHPKFGTLLASASYDGRVNIYRESPSQSASQPPTWSLVFTSTIHTASVNMVAWAPPELGCLLACASSDGNVSVLEFSDNQWGHTIFQAHGVGANAVSWAPSGVPGSILKKDGGAAAAQGPVRRFVTGGSDNAVKIWEWNNQTQNYDNVLVLPHGHTDWVRDVEWSPTLLFKTYIASASQDKTVRIWTSVNPADPASWTVPKVLTFDAVVWRVSWSLSGNILAVSGGDNKVTLWKEDLKGEWDLVREVTE
ncbi:hypothetical protein DV737_g2901, partial [Chaetothyriales sp. CBS 132003]